MNAPYTGAANGSDSNFEPIDVIVPDNDTLLESLSDENHKALLEYLTSRLTSGVTARDRKLKRFAKIDKQISTWQRLNKEDSERERMEEVSGRQQALPMNLPLLATHLDDTVAFFSEVFAPLSGGFYTAKGTDQMKKLAEKMNEDSAAREYYTNVCMTFRSLVKYNIGGFHVEWEEADQQASSVYGKGNRWTALDMYNTLWDPSIDNVSKVSTEAEWAAAVEIKNRIWLIRKGLSGEFSRVDCLLEADNGKKRSTEQGGYKTPANKAAKYYRPPSPSAGLPSDALDDRTSTSDSRAIDWESYGAALSGEKDTLIQGFEVVTMYCWIVPDDFGLVPDADAEAMEKMGIDLEKYVELWKFKIIDSESIVLAEPVVPLEESTRKSSVSGDTLIGGSKIPMHISLLNHDQMEQAQRSVMELLRGFQRFSSYLANIYIAGMRKNIWGITAVDGTMFDVSKLREGDVAGLMESKQPGRDVRSGFAQMNNTAGVEHAIGAIDSVFSIVQRLFPSQGLPSQVAGIDRAVKNQVSAVMQGATRRLHMLARLVDSSLFTPSRRTAWENLNRADNEGIKDMKDEEVSKVLGSGILALEVDRIVELLTEIMVALIQNPDAAKEFDTSSILSYISKMRNLGVDLNDFKREAPQQNPEGGNPEESGVPEASVF